MYLHVETWWFVNKTGIFVLVLSLIHAVSALQYNSVIVKFSIKFGTKNILQQFLFATQFKLAVVFGHGDVFCQF